MGQGRRRLGEPSASGRAHRDTVGSFLHVGCAPPSDLSADSSKDPALSWSRVSPSPLYCGPLLSVCIILDLLCNHMV